MRDRGRASLSQPRYVAQATAAGGVSERNPAKSPIRNASKSVMCLDSFASKVRNQCWTGSVPPRGSGWVNDQHANFLLILNAGSSPTRYREVVLTDPSSTTEF